MHIQRENNLMALIAAFVQVDQLAHFDVTIDYLHLINCLHMSNLNRTGNNYA